MNPQGCEAGEGWLRADGIFSYATFEEVARDASLQGFVNATPSGRIPPFRGPEVAKFFKALREKAGEFGLSGTAR